MPALKRPRFPSLRLACAVMHRLLPARLSPRARSLGQRLRSQQARPRPLQPNLPDRRRPRNQSAPSFDIARVDAGGDAVIAGRAAPGATVDLLRGGRRLDQAVADASGQFVIVSPRLPAGNYELTLSARLPDGTVTSSKQGVSVTVNDVGPSTREAQPRADDDSKTASQPSSKPPRVTGEPPKRTAGLEAAPAIDAAPAADESSSSPSDAHAISSKVVSRGDSLWRISRVTYGDGARYALVYRANRDRVRNPNLIYPGQTLVIPVKRN